MTIFLMDIGKLKTMLKIQDLSLKKVESGAAIAVQLTNDAGEERIVCIENDIIEISLTVPASDKGANKALIKFLAKRLGIKANAIEIVAGLSGSQKLVSIIGLAPTEVTRKLSI